MRRVRVWDAPTRIGHWLLATSFLVAYLTAEREAWRLIHVKAGYVMLAVLLFRILWGVAGTRHARFSDFLFSPRVLWRYLRTLLRGQPSHFTGHNPAGAVSIFVLLLAGGAVVATGIASYEAWGGDWLAEWHDGLSEAMLIVVGIHVAGVLAGSLLHHENLAAAMITGKKLGADDEAIAPAAGLWGCAVLLLVVIVALWW